MAHNLGKFDLMGGLEEDIGRVDNLAGIQYTQDIQDNQGILVGLADTDVTH